MSFDLTNQSYPNNEEKNKELSFSREEAEARNIMHEIFKHNDDRGALSTLSLGMPGSCKTAIDCSFSDYAMENYPDDRIFWRNAIGAPLQFVKVKKWHVYVQKESGIHFYNRKTNKDVTRKLEYAGNLTWFKDFDDLYSKAKPGICNGVFFKDLHLKNVDYDEGTMQWFRFFRYLLRKHDWVHTIFDEYHEMVKSGSSGQTWREIADHSNDVSNARKCNVVLHGNAHQISEMDYRVVSNIMVFIQMYGARNFQHNMVNKKALAALPKPREDIGAWAWVSTGGRFGKFKVPQVYKCPDNLDIDAQIIKSEEKTTICNTCNHEYLTELGVSDGFCSQGCYHIRTREHRRRDGETTGRNGRLSARGRNVPSPTPA